MYTLLKIRRVVYKNSSVQIFQEKYYIEIKQPARKLGFKNDLRPELRMTVSDRSYYQSM